jgi:hypothetical protein
LIKTITTTMEIIKKIIRHYLVGILVSAIIIFVIIVTDYFISDYLIFPEEKNFLVTCLLGGVGFGLTFFANYEIKKNLNKTSKTKTKKS